MKDIRAVGIAFFGALAFAACAVKAETVVWYTFDDLGDVGDHVADAATVVNKANPGTHDATLYGMQGMKPKPASTALPIATNGIPDSVRIYDPVSGTVGASADSALFFPCGSSSGNGAMLEIENDPDLRMQSFTVEALVRFRVNSSGSSGGWEAIASQISASAVQNTSDYAWYLGIHDNVHMKSMVLSFTNETYGASYTLTDGNVDCSDSKWHHVAFSVEPNASDPTHTDLKFYFDYALMDSKTFNFPVEFPTAADRPVQIGGDTIRNRLFQGDMSEFRISSGALTPFQFLRHNSSAAGDIDPDCVLYYDFEDSTDDWSWFGPAGDVVNKAMPGLMGGKIVTNNNLAPEFVEDTPESYIYQSLHDTAYRNSEKALCNYVEDPTLDWNSVNYGGYVKCQPLDTAWFSKTNFTIETFFMTTNNVQKWAPFFQRKGGWNVQFAMGISTAGGTVGYNITTNETIGQVEQQASSFTVGEWHHFAIVVNQTGETKRLVAYLDNAPVRTLDLDSYITQNNRDNMMNTYNGAWFIAGGPGGCSFDGKIDSMRVTLRALEPDEFLNARNSPKKFPAGRTLAHVKFDDGTVNADPEGGTMTNGVNGAASGGAPATFSDDVPGAVIRDGENGEIITKHNTKSISLSGSKVTWGSSSDGYQDTHYISRTLSGEKRTSWTVEFWMKPNGQQESWNRILTATADGELGNWYPYALTFVDARHLSFRSLARAGGVKDSSAAEVKFANWDITSVDVTDGKWHHVAFTFAPSEADSTKSEVKFYIDYGEAYSGTKTAAGLIEYPERLVMNLGNGSKNYNGLIDELRISVGALEPSQFLRAENAPGLSIIVR